MNPLFSVYNLYLYFLLFPVLVLRAGFGLFCFCFLLNIPVNNLSVILGRLTGFNSTK